MTRRGAHFQKGATAKKKKEKKELLATRVAFFGSRQACVSDNGCWLFYLCF